MYYVLRIRVLFGTQEEARPDRPETMDARREVRETGTQINRDSSKFGTLGI